MEKRLGFWGEECEAGVTPALGFGAWAPGGAEWRGVREAGVTEQERFVCGARLSHGGHSA